MPRNDENTLDSTLFRSLIDDIYDEIVIWDHNSNLLYINKACYRHYGLRPEDMIGRNIEELSLIERYWGPTTVPYVQKERKAAMQRQKTLLGTDIVTISIPILDEEGNIKYILQSVRDDDAALAMRLEPIEGAGAIPLTGKNGGILHRSECMAKTLEYGKKISGAASPCLILGETGTGKSLLARFIHDCSNRKDKPFVTINMASMNPTIIESELFGYRKGAFTGANAGGKKGLFEMANGGTLFLDEIGELPYSLQAKFLHVIQEKEYIPIGGTTPVPTDFVIIAATNCDLKKMIDAGRFREDLYHRLSVFEITIPPLRERLEDLHLLTSYFLNVFNKKYSKNSYFSDEALDVINNYPWKGNVRELSNVIERSVLTAEGSRIRPADLPNRLFKITDPGNRNFGSYDSTDVFSLTKAMENFEKEIVLEAYEKHSSSRKVAKALGISQTKACKLISKYTAT